MLLRATLFIVIINTKSILTYQYRQIDGKLISVKTNKNITIRLCVSFPRFNWKEVITTMSSRPARQTLCRKHLIVLTSV